MWIPVYTYTRISVAMHVQTVSEIRQLNCHSQISQGVFLFLFLLCLTPEHCHPWITGKCWSQVLPGSGRENCPRNASGICVFSPSSATPQLISIGLIKYILIFTNFGLFVPLGHQDDKNSRLAEKSILLVKWWQHFLITHLLSLLSPLWYQPLQLHKPFQKRAEVCCPYLLFLL